MGHASDGVDHSKCGDLLVVALMMSPLSSDYRRSSSSFGGPVIPAALGVILESSTCLLSPPSNPIRCECPVVIHSFTCLD